MSVKNRSGASHERSEGAFRSLLPASAVPFSPAPHSSRNSECDPMAKSRGEFTDLLVKKQLISLDQVEEARALTTQAGMKLHDALVKLGYLTTEQVMQAVAEFNGLQFVDLTDVTVPASVVEQVPESVARENVIMP